VLKKKSHWIPDIRRGGLGYDMGDLVEADKNLQGLGAVEKE
jgi:hypothetical protein